jgi:hypothetical protein
MERGGDSEASRRRIDGSDGSSHRGGAVGELIEGAHGENAGGHEADGQGHDGEPASAPPQ